MIPELRLTIRCGDAGRLRSALVAAHETAVDSSAEPTYWLASVRSLKAAEAQDPNDTVTLILTGSHALTGFIGSLEFLRRNAW